MTNHRLKPQVAQRWDLIVPQMGRGLVQEERVLAVGANEKCEVKSRPELTEARRRNNMRLVRSLAKIHGADPELILQACIFEIVSRDVNDLAVPAWTFEELGLPVETRNFRYEEMIYPSGRGSNQWGQGSSVPDVSRSETKLWFYFLARSYIDIGCEAIHYGQAELLNGNDPKLDHWAESLAQARRYAAKHRFWIWGWDEITWFSQEPENARNDWLRYAWKWVREHDPVGYLQMPGMRVISGAADGKRGYDVNQPGAATPNGFGQEQTIRAIWAADTNSASVRR